MPYMQLLPLLWVVPSLFLSLPLFTQLERVGADRLRVATMVFLFIPSLPIRPSARPSANSPGTSTRQQLQQVTQSALTRDSMGRDVLPNWSRSSPR